MRFLRISDTDGRIEIINELAGHVRADAVIHTRAFGLKEFNVQSKKERIRRSRWYVYEAGALIRTERGTVRSSRTRCLKRSAPDALSVTDAIDSGIGRAILPIRASSDQRRYAA